MKNIVEREINFWNMFWNACLKWRIILLCGLIFAILGGFAGYTRSTSTGKSGEGKISYDQLEESDQMYVNYYVECLELYEGQKEYNENALLMKLNSDGFYQGEITYYIDNHYSVEYPIVEKENNVGIIKAAYKKMIYSDDLITTIEKMFAEEGAKELYAAELVDTESLYRVDEKKDSQVDEGIMVIDVYANDEEKCKELMQIVEEEIEKQKKEIEKKVGEHDLVLVADKCYFTVENNILKKKKDNDYNMLVYRNEMKEASSNMSDVGRAYIENYKTGVEEQNYTEDTTVEGRFSIDKKFVIIGFLGGLFISFVFFLFKYILSHCLKFEDDIEEILGIRLLGNVICESNRKRNPLDRIFIKMKHMNKRYPNEEEALDLLAVNINIIAGDIDSKAVCAICTNTDKDVTNTVREINERTEKNGVRINSINSVLYDSKAMQELSQADAVVLIEKAEKTFYEEIIEEIKVCKQCNVKILGMVLVA